MGEKRNQTWVLRELHCFFHKPPPLGGCCISSMMLSQDHRHTPVPCSSAHPHPHGQHWLLRPGTDTEDAKGPADPLHSHRCGSPPWSLLANPWGGKHLQETELKKKNMKRCSFFMLKLFTPSSRGSSRPLPRLLSITLQVDQQWIRALTHGADQNDLLHLRPLLL